MGSSIKKTKHKMNFIKNPFVVLIYELFRGDSSEANQFIFSTQNLLKSFKALEKHCFEERKFELFRRLKRIERP